MKQCELRKKAANVIREKGFTTGILQNSKGECCILGALLIAKDIKLELDKNGTAHYYAMFREHQDLKEAVKEMDFFDFRTAFYWNDDSDRTKEDVIKRLEDGCL